MGQLKIFENEEFGQIRTVMRDGEVWFVGKDVAEALGYGKGKSLANAVSDHVDPEDKGVTKMMTPGGNQKVTIINESGLYTHSQQQIRISEAFQTLGDIRSAASDPQDW